MVDLSIIIVSYNTEELLKKCLESIFSQNRSISFEVIVIDNASTDGSAEAISNFQFIRNKKNVGFAKANNQGVKLAKGKYLLFLNPDTIVYPKTLEGMVAFMEGNQHAGVATCRVNLPNKKLDDASHRGFPTPWNAFCYFSGLSKLLPSSKLLNGYNLGWMDLSKKHEIDSCAGAFMMVRREAGESIGWWDEDYFWYGEDLDFCYRLKKNGWKIFFVPLFSILHYKGVSGGIKRSSRHISSASKETRIRATKARFEAMKIFYKKHYMNTYPRIITWLVMQGINLKLYFNLRFL